MATAKTLSFVHVEDVRFQERRLPGKDDTPRQTDRLVKVQRSEDRWRPQSHVIAPSGWLNDPCAPAYDENTGLYHLFYQWNPTQPEWGNICWGHASSYDLVHWTHDERPSLSPSAPYDCLGIFTGSMLGRGPKGEREELTIVYTSVNHLPIHYTRNYHRGSESLSLAISRDQGRTWSRHKSNPILPGPPLDVDIVAWRDPQVFSSSEIDRLLGFTEGQYLYGLISGGIKNRTPTVFLYAVKAADLTDWTYLGPIADFGLNWKPGRWTGDFGVNWEVSNMFHLSNNVTGADRTFLTLGVEGGSRTAACFGPNSGPSREPRWPLWVSGPLKLVDGHPLLIPEISGVLDHGCYYAANSFEDTKHNRRIIWGWILEDDIDVDHRRQQGWAGVISLPRELRYISIHNVISALHTPVPELNHFATHQSDNGFLTLETMGISPIKELETLRGSLLFQTDHVALNRCSPHPPIFVLGKSWEFSGSAKLFPNCTSAGLKIRYGAKFNQHVVIYFDQVSEELIVDRSCSTTLSGVNKEQESGPHTLFYQEDPNTGCVELERLRLRIFMDGSVLEVYANDRFALSTRIYPEYMEEQILDFYVNSENDADTVVWDDVRVWELESGANGVQYA